jgi:hypothetical protein
MGLHFRVVAGRSDYVVERMETRVRHSEGHEGFGDVAENARYLNLS